MCEEYWPENADTPFVPAPDSPLSIQYDSVLPFPEFIIRKMTVTNVSSSTSFSAK